MKSEISACWNISIDSECPHCNHLNDLFNCGVDFFELYKLQICEHANDLEVVCKKCGKEYTTDLIY